MTHLQDQVYVVPIFKVVVQFQNGRMFESALDLHLISHPGNHTARLHQLLVNLRRQVSQSLTHTAREGDGVGPHHFDGHIKSVFLAPCSVDAGKASLAQQVQYIIILEQGKADINMTPLQS